MSKKENAYKIYKYWLMYREYLVNHNLDSDVDTITIERLIDFVDNHIDTEEKKTIWEFCEEAY